MLEIKTLSALYSDSVALYYKKIFYYQALNRDIHQGFTLTPAPNSFQFQIKDEIKAAKIEATKAYQ